MFLVIIPQNTKHRYYLCVTYIIFAIISSLEMIYGMTDANSLPFLERELSILRCGCPWDRGPNLPLILMDDLLCCMLCHYYDLIIH